MNTRLLAGLLSRLGFGEVRSEINPRPLLAPEALPMLYRVLNDPQRWHRNYRNNRKPGPPRHGHPKPCDPKAASQFLTYPQFDQLVRLKGRRWAEHAVRQPGIGRSFAALLALAKQPA